MALPCATHRLAPWWHRKIVPESGTMTPTTEWFGAGEAGYCWWRTHFWAFWSRESWCAARLKMYLESLLRVHCLRIIQLQDLQLADDLVFYFVIDSFSF